MPKIMKSLNNISRCQAAFRAERLKTEGLCPQHHSFVLAVCGVPGRSQEEISRELCLNKSTVARNLMHLEEKGYITRVPVPEDKRRFSVYPTDKMLAVYPEVRAIAREWNSLLAGGVSEEDMAVFMAVLKQMEATAKDTLSMGEAVK